MAAGDQFDGVGNDFTADQRRLHALRSHGDAVRHGDGVVFNRRPTSGPDSGFHALRQAPQMVIAGHDFDPGIGYSDQGFGQIFIGESNRLEHGARRRSARANQQIVTLELQYGSHGCDRSFPYFLLSFLPLGSVSMTSPVAASMCTSVTL